MPRPMMPIPTNPYLVARRLPSGLKEAVAGILVTAQHGHKDVVDALAGRGADVSMTGPWYLAFLLLLSADAPSSCAGLRTLQRNRCQSHHFPPGPRKKWRADGQS